MKRPAVFFDRDNTLIANDGYLGDPAGVKLIPGAANAVGRAKSLGFAVVTISNQSGVARGMFDEDAVRAVNGRMDEMLAAADAKAVIDGHEYCPFHPEGTVEEYRQESPLRKPSPGMIYKAAEAMDLDLAGSWLVGDAGRDIDAGKAAGCRTILFHDPSLVKSPATTENGAVRPDYVVTTLKEAVDIIERERHRKPASPAAKNPLPLSSNEGTRLEMTATQILLELKRRNEREHVDFSMAKLLAGIVQVVVLAVLFVAYLNHQSTETMHTLLLLAIVLQTMAAALLLIRRN